MGQLGPWCPKYNKLEINSKYKERFKKGNLSNDWNIMYQTRCYKPIQTIHLTTYSPNL